MSVIYLSKERRARVWLGELPYVGYFETPRTSTARLAECAGAALPVRSKAAIELFIPAGARFYYGLIGIEADGVCSESPSLSVGNFRHKLQPFGEGPLTGKLDNVVPWIDSENFEAIEDGALRAMRQFKYLPASLVFTNGGQGVFGSTPAFFARIAYICVSLLGISVPLVPHQLEHLISLSSDMSR